MAWSGWVTGDDYAEQRGLAQTIYDANSPLDTRRGAYMRAAQNLLDTPGVDGGRGEGFRVQAGGGVPSKFWCMRSFCTPPPDHAETLKLLHHFFSDALIHPQASR